MTGTNCDLFTHKSVPVIFEPPCIISPAANMLSGSITTQSNNATYIPYSSASQTLCRDTLMFREQLPGVSPEIWLFSALLTN
jgi:hypothetical protein